MGSYREVECGPVDKTASPLTGCAGSVCTQGTPNPPILAIDKHQVRPLHPGPAWAEPPGPVDLSWHSSPIRLPSGFRTREERGASVGAGYSRGTPGRRVSGPSRKGDQARPFLAPGLSQGAWDQVATKSQPTVGLLHWAPVVLKPLASTLPGAISSQKASAQAPGRPFMARDWLKPPQCLLVHRTSSAHPSLTPALTVV